MRWTGMKNFPEFPEVIKAIFMYEYSKDPFIVTSEEGRYSFHKIQNLIVFEPDEIIYLKCKELEMKYNHFFTAH